MLSKFHLEILNPFICKIMHVKTWIRSNFILKNHSKFCRTFSLNKKYDFFNEILIIVKEFTQIPTHT